MQWGVPGVIAETTLEDLEHGRHYRQHLCLLALVVYDMFKIAVYPDFGDTVFA